MSKLVDLLQRISRGGAQPIGFRPGAAMSKGPSMALIASLSPGDAVGGRGADAVLFPLAKMNVESLRKTIASLGDTPWGVSLEEMAAERISQLAEMGCDFLVFEARAPLAFLREGKLGKLVQVEPSLAEGLIRAIEQLPIDAVLIGMEGELSVKTLMECQHVANLVSKPLVVQIPMGISTEELEELSEIGIVGVVVRVEGGIEEELSRLRQAIAELSPPRRRRERAEPLIPQPGGEITMPEEEDV